MKKFFAVLVIAIAGIVLVIFYAHKSITAFHFSSVRAEIASGQDFDFFIVSDPHFLSDDLHDHKEAFQRFLSFGDKLVHYSDELMNAVISDILREKPDFLLVTGDLTCNGEMDSHKKLAEKFRQIEEAGTSVFVIPGNHDVLNPMARQFFENTIWEADYITKDMFADIYADFGYQDAVSRDHSSLSYLASPSDDVWLLMLDSAIYHNNIKKNHSEDGGIIRGTTIEWIEQCAGLAKEKNAKMIAVMHHSLLHHSELINQDYTLQNSAEISALFSQCDIPLVFTGHVHLQDIRKASVNGKAIHDIATSCLSVYPNQYGIVNYNAGKGYYYKTNKVNMKQYAEEHNSKDEALLSFEKTSINFFVNHCCKSQNQCLSEMEGLTEEEMAKVKDTVSKMNMRYFAGFRNEKMDDLVDTEGYRILEGLPSCFIQDYVRNMLRDEISDHNTYFIPEK
ncbi:MAG: metallophosphoesterase [Eubacteriales bacterium]|nr:metallophosphoesterase [Eubacteriales bacterium]